jgi:hypothetical protein
MHHLLRNAHTLSVCVVCSCMHSAESSHIFSRHRVAHHVKLCEEVTQKISSSYLPSSLEAVALPANPEIYKDIVQTSLPTSRAGLDQCSLRKAKKTKGNWKVSFSITENTTVIVPFP